MSNKKKSAQMRPMRTEEEINLFSVTHAIRENQQRIKKNDTSNFGLPTMLQ